MIFNEIDTELRTNESFLLQTQVEHHNGVSPLAEIKFPMVTGFILDSMHLIYLGIMKRILVQLVQGNNYYYDVRNYGKPLDNLSAFDFENLLGKIKRSLCSGNKPLSQLSRRLSESNFNSFKYNSKWELKRKHKRGPLLDTENSSMNTYSIVEFIEESTVEIIPSSWVESGNQTALWPKGIIPSILKRHLKNHTEPSADWSSVKIRVLGQADTLANAEKKAQKAEDTSQLSSDSDSQTFLPLKRSKKPSRFNISLSDKESVLNEPLIQSKKRTQKFGNTDSANVSTPPVVPPFPESQANKDITGNKFSQLLPITSIESFNEIDNSLANSEEDFVSLVKI
ncbi:hypothetical protein DMN91_011329 [Ooceraea biroi]|uniref:Uncharacterized protein n=1 Tax=Ooceraea biroi TaxID=2015173 RepID=A0A3L8D9S1_OOCBI|nr:hypothetical protein DMN91_011329 [Ooceraea biroi]